MARRSRPVPSEYATDPVGSFTWLLVDRPLIELGELIKGPYEIETVDRLGAGVVAHRRPGYPRARSW